MGPSLAQPLAAASPGGCMIFQPGGSSGCTWLERLLEMLPAMLRFPGVAALWALVLLGARPALAQDDSWAFVTAVTGPMDRVEASFEELGVPLPSFLQREAYENEDSFAGPDGLREAGVLG